jgi:formate-nitrite transporter family protein
MTSERASSVDEERSPDNPRSGSGGDGARTRRPRTDTGGVEVATTFERTVQEGETRLTRTWPGLLATGMVGGIDVGMGVFALFLVDAETGNVLLSALAFGIGFMAVTLAKSELFTENFLVPIASVAAGRAKPSALARLWAGTALTNLIGGWIFTGIVMMGLPRLAGTAVAIASFYPSLGISRRSFALALLGGSVITLMTWMERGTSRCRPSCSPPSAPPSCSRRRLSTTPSSCRWRCSRRCTPARPSVTSTGSASSVGPLSAT